MKNVLSIIALVAASTLASSAMASDFYVTGTVGQSNLRGTNLDDHTDTAAGISAGWQFHPNLAVELGYTNLGKFGGDVDAKAESFQATLVGTYPLGYKFSALGRVGIADTSLNVPGDGNGYTHRGSAVYGAGVLYQVTPHWATTVEWDQYNKFAATDTKLNTVVAGVKYTF